MITDEETIRFLSEGYLLLRDRVRDGIVEKILDEADPWLRQITWNDTYGYSLDGSEILLANLGICSKAAVEFFLCESLLDSCERMFGADEVILSSFALQSTVSRFPGLPFHSDRAGGILVFLFLSDMNSTNGYLSVVPGTQHCEQYFFVPTDVIEERKEETVHIFANAGDILIMHQDVWHERHIGVAGRVVVKALYHPATMHSLSVDHRYRQSCISGLNMRQLRAFGITRTEYSRFGYLDRVGRPFSRSDTLAVLRHLASRRFLRLFR